MALKTASTGAIRRLLSQYTRGEIKQLLLDAGASKERILPIQIVNNLKSKDYLSKSEILSLMFDPIYKDFDTDIADLVLLELVKLMFTINTDFSQPRLNLIQEVRNKLRLDGIDFDNRIAVDKSRENTHEIKLSVYPSYKYDFFICHASEDKESFVRSLANALSDKGLRVWYDESSLTIGDSLRRSIDHGLNQSKFGVVVLSSHFFEKEWPQRELDGLTAREVDGVKVILPIWHGVGRDEVFKYSPVLADRIGVQTSKGLDYIVAELIRAKLK